jgi:hypothetical protein
MTIRRVKESFACPNPDGGTITFTSGQLIETTNFPGYSGKEHLFEDVETYVARGEENKKHLSTPSPTVEATSANPGEKRSVTPAPNAGAKREFKPPIKDA